MLIRARVIPNSRIGNIQRMGDGSYRIKVLEKAIGGKANKAAIAMLSLHLKVRKSSIAIVKGVSSRDKVFEISAAT
ncbi:MAG: DUF167 domain-containing protein [Candidatus Micrarchaeota archaeon]|nr:DUF167 domain-containing protein [Candidatus Micrarchaeota archaeon]